MKKLLLLACCLTTMGFALAQDNNQKEPTFNNKVIPEPRVFDFGLIKEDQGLVSHKFLLKNTSNKPIAISEVHAWCGCTTAEFTKKAILPGKSGEVNVTFNPYGRPGKFSKEVIVLLSNNNEFVRIWVKGNVEGVDHPIEEDHPYDLGEGLRINQLVFPFPPREVGQNYMFNMHLANASDKTIKVQFLKQPDNKVLKIPAELILKPNERIVVPMTYRKPRQHKYDCYVIVQPMVNGKKVKPLRVKWLADK